MALRERERERERRGTERHRTAARGLILYFLSVRFPGSGTVDAYDRHNSTTVFGVTLGGL
jgi:hypothetical protein